MSKLKSMTDFVLDKLNNTAPVNFITAIEQIRNYAELLKQPLNKGMFVPCDEDLNVLEEIISFDPDISSQYYASQMYHNELFKRAKCWRSKKQV